MRTRLAIGLLLGVGLAACQAVGPTATSTPQPPPTLTPQPAASPTATLLAQDLSVRLGTSDPSPACSDIIPIPWFFDNPAHECASGVVNKRGTVQYFEHGLMVWFEDGGRTYILIDDGSLFKPYQEVTDPGTYQSAPEAEIDPPPGLYTPTLGFAKFWRGIIPGYEWIRERLGWATAPEARYSAVWQCNTASGDAARCYFTGPKDEIIVMSRGSAQYWNYWQGPVR